MKIKIKYIYIILVLLPLLIIGIYKAQLEEEQYKDQTIWAYRCSSVETYHEILNEDYPVLFLIGRNTCIHCKELSEQLEVIQPQYKNEIIIKYIDLNKQSEFEDIFQVLVTPTVFYYENGQLVDRFYDSLTIEQLQEYINEAIN